MTTAKLTQLHSQVKKLSDTLERLLSENASQDFFLIKAKEVFSVTIWRNKRDLAQAVQKGYIKKLKQGKSTFYDLNSIHDDFKIKK